MRPLRARALAGVLGVAAAATVSRTGVARDGGSSDSTNDARCSPFGNDNARTYHLLLGCAECMVDLHPMFDRCHTDPRGAWGFVIDRAAMTTWNGDGPVPRLSSLVVGWNLVRRTDTDGSAPLVASVEPFLDSAEEVASEGVNWSIITEGWDTITVSPPEYFDFDGDGVDEVILHAHRNSEGYSAPAFEIWTVRGGRVVPYPTGIKTAITGIDDVDGDGRPDIETIEVGADVTPGIGSPIFVGPTVVYHSLPNGAFSGRDAVARGAFERACPPELRALDEASFPTEEETLVMRVACARAAGMSAAAVREVLAKYRFRDSGQQVYPPPAVLDPAIDEAPSFVLR